MTAIKVSVFVSGAGPVGLFFAYQMASRGHSVFILDPKAGPTKQSRAILVTSRTLEILEGKGFVAEFLSKAFVSSGIRMYRNGAIVGQVDANGDTLYPHMTSVLQGITETIFKNRLEEDTDCRVHWGNELVSYTQDDFGVKSIIRNIHTNVEQVIESTYIVGADGSHSRVRKGVDGWTYEGVAIATKFIVADIAIKGKNLENMLDKTNTFMNGLGVMGMVRINPPREYFANDPNVYFRLFGNLEGYQKSENTQKVNHGIASKNPEEAPSLEFIQSWMDKMTTPLKFEGSNVLWSAFFKINERLANGFRRKRAFIIGDAAHCSSPAGGQGLNTGLQDADNLAWKMSDILNGLSADPEKLLDSYSAEREPQARATIEATSTATQAGLSGSSLVSNIRAHLVSTALMVPQIRHYAFKNMMQQNVCIDSKSAILGVSDKCLIKAGKFLPDTGTLRKSFGVSSSKPRTIERLSIREILICNQQHTVIFIGTCHSQSLPNVGLIEKFWKDTKKYPIRRLVIQSVWHSHLMNQFPDFITKEEESIAEQSFYSEERIALPISVTSRVGLLSMLNSSANDSTPSVVLFVRPDFYVAQAKVIRNKAELDCALQFLATTFH